MCKRNKLGLSKLQHIQSKKIQLLKFRHGSKINLILALPTDMDLKVIYILYITVYNMLATNGRVGTGVYECMQM